MSRPGAVPCINKMKKKGFVKIHRSVEDKGYYKKSEYLHLWVHLILKANHQPREAWFDGKNTIVKRGQLITGRKMLSEQTGIHESKIVRILNCFEKTEQQIEQQKTGRGTLITITNYNKHHLIEQPTEQQVNNNRTTSEHKQEREELKNGNKTRDKAAILKAEISTMKETLKKTWDKNLKFYTTKYPDRDHDLEFKSMIEWIDTEPAKAKRRFKSNQGDWNLFCQRWLSRSIAIKRSNKSSCNFDVISTEKIMTDKEILEDRISQQNDLLKSMSKDDPDWQLENDNLDILVNQARGL